MLANYAVTTADLGFGQLIVQVGFDAQASPQYTIHPATVITFGDGDGQNDTTRVTLRDDKDSAQTLTVGELTALPRGYRSKVFMTQERFAAWQERESA